MIEDQTVNYTVSVGRMPVSVEEQHCQMFFTAYTLDEAENKAQRPITFAFNGGPGSSSGWVNMGMLGPRRVETDENGQPKHIPVDITDNPYSILDPTDPVFIDPVGTSYSRADKGTDPDFFIRIQMT